MENNIIGYQIIKNLYKSEKTSVFLAFNQHNEKFVLKTTSSAYPSPNELKRFETEFAISQSVQNDGIVKVLALLPQGNSVIIVSEYIESPTISNFLKDRKISVKEGIKIAINITKALEIIHQNNVIHKDINSNNILINPDTLQTTIIDFDIATQLSVEKREIANINQLEGSLLYISPEQTGRMNRNIDYRTDLYSLGVVMYEMLVGELPFKTTEHIELIHAHIALMPKAPHLINKEISEVISKIVLKLLSKNAEDRYQSAKGLENDLNNCLEYLERGEEINFELGKTDHSDKFHIPQKLYGREEDTKKLLQVFDKVCQEGKPQIMLVKGYSGIGKSALIQEIQKPITEEKGYYIKGKFEQFQRNIPYSAIIQAFDVLIDNILTESKEKVTIWKNDLLDALEGNGDVIVEVIPRLEFIIGKQPEVEKLPAAETQNRFNYTFEEFIKVFTKQEHPIALVIDDLQWADTASLRLIELFLQSTQNQYLFIVASYRDNEVDATHPLTLMLKNLSEYTEIQSISLNNLTLQHTKNIVADTLKVDENSSESLAKLIFDKTQGNPFFVNQFLITLYEEKLLTFDYNNYQWKWDNEKIKAQNITDNVVELLVNKIEKLPKETIQLLQFAAAFNNQFDASILGAILEINSETEIENYLEYALEEQLISRTKKGYKFQHDRIQQASYSLIEEKSLASVHLKIGQTLLKSTSNEKLEQEIFNIINQFNQAKELVNDVETIKLLKDLNFQASVKAKNANAYVSALDYLEKSLAFTNENIWQDDYNFALNLFTKLMEVEYLNGNFENSEKYAQNALENVQNNLEKADIYNTLIVQATLRAKYNDAIEYGKKALDLLDFSIPNDANLEAGIGAGIGAVMQNLAGRDILSLVDAPDAQEKRDILVAKILVNLASPAYLSNPNLWTFIIVNATALGLGKGNVPELATAYSSYGILSGIIFGDYKSGYQYGELSYKLSEKYNNLRQKCNTCFVLGLFLIYPTKPAKEIMPILQEGMQIGLQSGELQFASYNISFVPIANLLQGNSLHIVIQKIEDNLQVALKYQNTLTIDILISTYTLVSELTDKQIKPPHNLPYQFENIVKLTQQNQSIGATFVAYSLKAIADLVMHQTKEASKNIGEAQKLLPFVMGTLQYFTFHFYYPIIQLKMVIEGLADKEEVLEQIKDFVNKLKTLSELNPANFYNKYTLIQAMTAQIDGNYLEAMDLYEIAIEESRKQGFIFENALATESAALFYEKLNKPKIAQLHWQEAHQLYNIWGATKKVEQLQKKYNYLLKGKSGTQFDNITFKSSIKETSVSSSQSKNINDTLDFVTLIKASQMLSQEVVLDSLLEKMMKILIENSGAERGFLFLYRNEKLYLEAEVDESATKINILQSILLDEIKEDEFLLSTEIVNYVVRVQQIVVLDDAAHKGQFTHIPYIKKQKVKSLLCMPLLKTGKIVGILYLENNLSIGAFTNERLEILKVLSSQIAISVENALLYENLEDKVEERTLQLNQAYQEIKEQNGNITASINYGQRIQEAILPNIELIKQNFKEHFILFRPRDIVSGDFYWFAQKGEKAIIAAVDCTGHGVPGAFMSMIGHALLSEIILANNILSPSLILKKMDEAINQMLKQHETQNRDGMDLTLCVWDKSEKLLHFAGAKNSLVYIQDNELQVIKGSIYGIGGEIRKKLVNFEEYTIKIDKPTHCYIYSDGYQDQFGGELNKKFMKTEFRKLLFDIHKETFEEQKEILDRTLLEWRKDIHQTDDVLVIGFKIE
ncbi:MAG: GAF domain-containing protein [Bacteroidetes bacterium]|nr:MAG: GAF domain-containing protein [Bacteroidota bacterium]TAG88357.1 MAG: GAF domain-containing protein [Bacteroidota bacterium]